MGAWGTNIKDNDTTADIYADFFDLYNEGLTPVDISAKLITDNEELINDPDDCNNFWFALALAQWETKSLDLKNFEKVKAIIESGNDIQVWKNLDADDSDLEKRRIALEKFLAKLQTEKVKPKPREKPRNVKPIFATGDCLAFRLNNGNYGGVVILATNNDPKLGYNLVAGTRINQSKKPTLSDFEKAEILVLNFAFWRNDKQVVWISPDQYEKEYSNLFELIGKISVEKEYTTSGNDFTTYSANWASAKEAAERQFEHGKNNPKPAIILTVAGLTKKKRRWKFF
jgi:hypothetical protein